MVKRRPSRAVQPAHGSRIRVFSPESLDCARYASRVQNEEKCDLLSEKSFMLSSEFPVVEIDASKFNHDHSRRSNNNHAPILRLPRTNFKNKLADSSQHYVLISNNSLDLPLSSHSKNNDRNNPISMDLVNLSAKELAEREATVNKKVRQLKAKGLWMRDRLPKVMEPERLLTHWDFFLEEALWLADDFKQERMWKRAMSKRLASEAALAVMIRAELARRETLELELHRQRGAAKIAQLIREWWSGISKAPGVASLLSGHHQWESALRQNRLALTQLTDTGANWLSSAISRSVYPTPGSVNSVSFLDDEEIDADYSPPRSSATSITSENPSEEPATIFNLDDFEWGLQSEALTTVESYSSQQSEDGGDDDDDSDSVSSSHFSNASISEEDLIGLRSDAALPLHEVLESALDNGWTPQQQSTALEGRILDFDLDFPSSVDLESPHQSTVNALRHEATLPLRQFLPPGYHPISTTATLTGVNGSDGGSGGVSLRRRQLLRRSNRPNSGGLLNGSLTHEDSPTNDSPTDGLDDNNDYLDGEGISEASGDGGGVEPMEVDGYPSDSELSAASSLVTWNNGETTSTSSQQSFPPLPPAELARRARSLEALRVQTPTRKLMQSRLQAFGPTCRVPFLPTPSLYSGVSWLSNTYAQRVPTCLVSYSAPCADAALCLAVHIGQLAASNGGDWGPHLVVTPRLLLPTWRARFMAVCPGLRVHCVLASSRGGTGRRLKASAAQGAFHVCLTTYSALRSRPSRFEGISWHMIVLDQVQHLTDPSPPDSSNGGSVDLDSILMEDSSAFSTPNGHRQSHHSTTANSSSLILPDLVHTLIHRLLPSAYQRVCIYSAGIAGDICQGNAAFIKILFSLLLLSSSTEYVNYGTLIEDAVRQASLIKPESSNSTTAGEVLAALEPFIYRFFDEDEEEDEEEFDLYLLGGGDANNNNSPIAAAERLVRFKVLSDILTPEQRKLHDQLLLDRTCTRASRSGHLCDLLTCLSKGVRLCLHPWLLAGYDEAPYWLAQDREPAPLPPCPLMRFDTPSGLAALSKQNAEKCIPIPLLSMTLQEKTHIRNRIVELLPSSEQLKATLASPKISYSPVQLGKRRGGVTLIDGSGSQLPKKMAKVEGVEAVEEQSGAFITEEIYRTVLLEEAKAAFDANKDSTAVSKVNDFKFLLSVPSKIAIADQTTTSNLTTEAKTRLHIFESRCRHTRLELEDTADWCSSSTMEYIQQHSRLPSLFPSGIHVFPVLPFIDSPTLSTSNAICRVVLDRFNHLHSLNSPYSVFCTRDSAVGLPVQLTDVSPDSLFFDMQEVLDAVNGPLYPLLPLSRWISPQAAPHCLAQFLAASGKIQRLRDLLLEFVRTPPETELNQSSTATLNSRPRVIFIMSHYAAFLDLLTVWLSVDPAFSCLTRIRTPIDHLDASRGQCRGECMDYYSSDIGAGWIERVNDWPCGIKGPLIVLMHGGAPLLSVAGLKAGPDTRVILCDAGWRQEVHALVKSKLRCWSINGLVDIPPRVRYINNPSSHRLPVYRIVSEWDSGESIEARLLKSSVIHLLPDSVFKTVANTSTTSFEVDAAVGTRSRLSAASAIVSPLNSSTMSRVQPNVVKELFFKLRRRAQWRAAGGETSTGMPMPSMESDGGEEEVTTQDEESDNASLFHNREPVQKQMLLQCFDLHEAPRDVQAWYSNLAEEAAIVAEMHGDEDSAVQNFVEEDLNESGLIHIAAGDFDALCQLECTEINLAPPEILERWEMDEEMWQKNYDAVESVLGYSDPLFFVPPSKYKEEEVATVMSVDEDFAHENDSPILDAFKLPVWVPSFFNDPDFYKDGLAAPYDKFIPAGNSNASKPCAKTLHSLDPWGYCSELMSESELPPLPPPPTAVPPLFDSTNTTSRSINATTATSSSYAIKRSAAVALSARSSVGPGGGVSAPSSKKRKLTGAAAMAAKRSASNKAAAAAAALITSTASSSGRVSHLEGDEKSLPGSTIHDRSEVPTLSTGPSTSTTISSNQKACLPRTFFARDARAITGSSAAVALQGSTSGAFGSSASSGSSYFTPTARFRRTTAGVSSFSRLSGATGVAGGANLPGGGAVGVYAALNNPHLHAKYALPMIEKTSLAASVGAMSSTQRQAIHTASGMVSFKFGSSGHVATSFNDVKPPEWTPLEEAALLMYTNKLLEVPVSNTNSHYHHSSSSSTSTVSSSGLRVPNFRLGELCLNSFIAMRAYRNARQCLIAYCRINSVVVSSSPNDLLPLPLGDGDKTGQHQYQHHHQVQHGVGRKVKNKMKSGMSSTPLLSSSPSMTLHGGPSLGVPGGAGDSPSIGSSTGAVNKLRGYQHFLYLQSQLNSLNVTAQPSTSVPSSTNTTLDSQSSNIMRRCIRESSLKHPNQPPGTAGSSKHPLQFNSTSASPAPHHHLQSAVGQVGGGGGQRSGSVGPVATTATMLMRNAAAAVAIASAGGPTQQQQLAMPAPLIQKNPSHIAALQVSQISFPIFRLTHLNDWI
ncbi:unnamed protein product [Hymenolepis diminuta]|uniref:HSA domain-containing protein n=2 Tax=Hymenolepis diminuta TaxID=6216 RepID=A0A158QD32_HYMDI|nr:unnamed protein product [Hymenolepis diminuta]